MSPEDASNCCREGIEDILTNLDLNQARIKNKMKELTEFAAGLVIESSELIKLENEYFVDEMVEEDFSKFHEMDDTDEGVLSINARRMKTGFRDKFENFGKELI